MIGEAAAFLGVDAPGLTLKSMLEVITFESAEIIPEQFNDGIPDPKATDSGQATT